MTNNDWHLHKAVPLGLLFILVSTFVTFTWKGATMAAQVFANTESIVELKQGIKEIQKIASSVARIEGALGIKK